MITRVASATDGGHDETAKLANIVHLQAADAAYTAADIAMETYGGASAVGEHGIAAVWNLVRHQKTNPITRNMKLNFIANNVPNLTRSYAV